MKLLIVAPFESKGRYKGGISTVVNNLYDSGKLQEKEIDVVKFDTCRIERSNVTEAGLNAPNIKNTYLVYTHLPRFVESEKPDTVYYHTSIGMALVKDCLIIKHVKKKQPNTRMVVHIHFADYNRIMPSRRILQKLILSILKKYTDKIVFLSMKTRDEFVKRGIKKEKAFVIYNFTTMSFEETILENKAGILKFLFVGAISQRKGIFDAISALKTVRGEYEFHICGDFIKPETKEEFNKAIVGIEDKVIFHGFVKGAEKEQIFSNSDLLVLPSYGEGLPVVILEAYSAGCAVIVSNVGAVPEIVSAKNGIVVNAGDIDNLALAFQKYLNEDREVLLEQQRVNFKEASYYTIDAFANSVYNVCFR